jgi:parallel beta-helix repeat protein
MDKKPLIGKYLAVGLILLLIGTGIIPSATSVLTNYKNIITVDDEPGDADFTSIKEAVDSSSPGDTIEVYSGTYPEQEIQINKENITLLGISHELGEGNDSGKPFIKGNGTDPAIWVIADKTTVSGFIMQKVLGQGDLIDVDSVNGCLISNNTIQNGTEYLNTGIDCFNSTSVQIIDNIIMNIDGDGIYFEESNNACICGNSISDSERGIYIGSSESFNITKNKIDGCDVGIRLDTSDNNTLYLNNLESNSIGLALVLSGKNIIKHNNFINNSQRNAVLIAGKVIIIQRWESVQNSWIENYWSDWSKIGPKIIPGVIFLLIVLIPVFQFILPIEIPLPLFQFDRHPAQEPYDIGS